jgi:uncharacterized protein (UPF0147 family)
MSTTLCQMASAEGCITKDEHDYFTFLLMESSAKPEDTASIRQTLTALKEMIRPGERVIAGVMGEKGSEARILMDVVKPKTSIWESTMKLRAKEQTFKNCLAELEKNVTSDTTVRKNVPLLETLSVISGILAADNSNTKRVIVHSPMVQHSDSLSFQSAKTVDAESALQKVSKDNLVSVFKGVTFIFAGAGRTVSDQKGRAIEAFWRKYVDKAGGVLNFYGPVLIGS